MLPSLSFFFFHTESSFSFSLHFSIQTIFYLHLEVSDSIDPFLPSPHCMRDFPNIWSSFSFWFFHFSKKTIFGSTIQTVNILHSFKCHPNTEFLKRLNFKISSEQNSLTPCVALTEAFLPYWSLIGGQWSRDQNTLLWLVHRLGRALSPLSCLVSHLDCKLTTWSQKLYSPTFIEWRI